MEPGILWSLRKPLIWLGGKIGRLLAHRTIERVLREAHQYHLDLRSWQRRWVALTDDVEYRLETLSAFEANDHDQPIIWVRNSGTTVIDELQLSVEARRGGVVLQNPLVVRHLSPGKLFPCRLPNFPLEKLSVHKGEIVASYDSFAVYPVRLARNECIEEFAYRAVEWHPSYDDTLNGKWLRFRGRLYNTKAINDYRHECRQRIFFKLCWRHGFPGTPARQLLCGALTWSPLLNAFVWTSLLVGRKRIEFAMDESMRQATKFILGKDRVARPVRVTRTGAPAA